MKKGLFVLFILFQVACYPIFLQHYVASCGRMEPVIQEIQKAKEVVPEKYQVAVFGGSGIKYFHPSWHVINIGSVTSPYFRDCKGIVEKIKKLQYASELQFQSLFTSDLDQLQLRELITGDSIVVEVPHPYRLPVYLFPIDWQKLCPSHTVLNSNLQKQLAHLQLVDKLDIAYSYDEKRCQYQYFSIYAYGASQPLLSKCPTKDDTTTVDASRGILGWDRFTFQTIPQKDHWLVIRSLIKSEVLFDAFDSMKNLTINTNSVPQLLLQIEKSNRLKIDWQKLISQAEGNVLEWTVKIPGHLITEEETTFSLLGDHIVCDYWLYTSK